MLLRLPLTAELPSIKKNIAGRDALTQSAFAADETLHFQIEVSRTLGAAAVVLRIGADGEATKDFPLSYKKSQNGRDFYQISLPFASLIDQREAGLYYYEFLFLRGTDTLFTDTAPDNLSFSLTDCASNRFRLLIYKKEYKTPAWFHGGLMYHIFVDRFAPGKGERPAGSVYHENWNEEILQFGEKPGDFVLNNEFYGGSLWGVLEKLPYLQSLGVTVLYLSPIFKAASNHKYDTGDYECTDPQFGGDKALRALLAAAEEKGIRIILDGVFNHTGDDSRYFDKYGNYGGDGAYLNKNSHYRDWYFFEEYPQKYAAWWGIPILPKLNLQNKDLQNYLLGEGGIVDRYTKWGVSGWRLDVADELPDAFLEKLRTRVKEDTAGEGIVIGEVWENAADKIAYGKRRRYFQGDQLDSVMNYPLREGIVSFVKEGNAAALCKVLTELWASYPESVCHSLMNILSTHDTERILTVLGGISGQGKGGSELRGLRMSPKEREEAMILLKTAAVLQYTVYGVPSLFYGDEAGMEGYRDPFCRRPYPWGAEEQELLDFYKRLGRLRRENKMLREGNFKLLSHTASGLSFERADKNGKLIVAANRGDIPFRVILPCGAVSLLGKKECGKVLLKNREFGIWRIE